MAMNVLDEPITAEGCVYGSHLGARSGDSLESASTCSEKNSMHSSLVDSESDSDQDDRSAASAFCRQLAAESTESLNQDNLSLCSTPKPTNSATETVQKSPTAVGEKKEEDEDPEVHKEAEDVFSGCTCKQTCVDSGASTCDGCKDSLRALQSWQARNFTLRRRSLKKTSLASRRDSSESDRSDVSLGGNRYTRRLSDVLLKYCPEWVFEPEEFIASPGKEKHSESVHRNADSFFTTSSGFNNYRGFLNLCIILLAVSNSRLFLENMIKYGFRGDPLVWVGMFVEEPYNWPNFLIILSMNFFILTIFAVEKLLARGTIGNTFGSIIYGVDLSILLVYPAMVVFYNNPNPMFSSLCLALVTVVILKLVSYGSVNYWCRLHRAESRIHMHRRRKSTSLSEGKRRLSESPDSERVSYPDNLTLNDLYYFMFAPTLCYEINFPRSQRIRKRFLVKRAVEMCFLIQLMGVLVQQWMVPGIENSVKPLAQMEYSKIVERMLKLAIPNHFIWLIFFYWMFHSCLNVIAELLKFGDREFYRDWWNAEDIAEFWKNWNVPVHRWCLRHVYKPLRSRGWGNFGASTMVFLLSAFFHEYLVSIPLKMFKIWALSGMLLQIPLAYLTKRLLKGKAGNMAMWLSLIMGQPICILAYLHDYYIQHVLPYSTNTTAHEFKLFE